ncbi:MAG: thioredoxin domain-containing protein [Methanoregula sp.]|nr:thioredoxin domain-containing protein [Methanoregula sp.]
MPGKDLDRNTSYPPNRLIREKSPYLLQHATNPVDWYPWSDEAFIRAAKEEKPVFLSIGYATCHWCHVMAHESFEDDEVAAVLNQDFICIKVDREERPDIDAVYMAVSQMLTGRGGWPLTIVMTPEKRPFFAGTYIPKAGRFGRTGIIDLLEKITSFWHERRGEILKSADEIVAGLASQEPCTPMDPDESQLTAGYEDLILRFDQEYGGFGSAPKFPTPHTLLFLLRYFNRTGKLRARAMVETTIHAILDGGIYDHLGGGIHRYSTDAFWRVPHFEKMLYDQALMLMACLETYQLTRKPEYGKAARDIIAYVLRDLTSPEGAFYTAEDADSEGGEGAFYLWTMEELEEVLGRSDAAIASAIFNVTPEGNFSEPGIGNEKTAPKNILYRSRSEQDLARALLLTDQDFTARIDAIRRLLFDARNKRPRPARDDKILSDWNGLFIAALGEAAWVFDDPAYARAAKRAMRFILTRLPSPDGGLMHRYREGEAAIPGFASDYAFTIRALLRLYETSFDPSLLEAAIDLQAHFTRHFGDREDGGFFVTSDRGEELLVRQKESYDGAIPSAGSVAFGNLLLLAQLTGNARYEVEASALARNVSVAVHRSPASYTWFLCELERALGTSREIVIVGADGDPGIDAMSTALRSLYLPTAVILRYEPGPNGSRLAALAPFVTGLAAGDGRATAYVCSGHACAMPVTDTEKMLELLGKK